MCGKQWGTPRAHTWQGVRLLLGLVLSPLTVGGLGVVPAATSTCCVFMEDRLMRPCPCPEGLCSRGGLWGPLGHAPSNVRLCVAHADGPERVAGGGESARMGREVSAPGRRLTVYSVGRQGGRSSSAGSLPGACVSKWSGHSELGTPVRCRSPPRAQCLACLQRCPSRRCGSILTARAWYIPGATLMLSASGQSWL